MLAVAHRPTAASDGALEVADAADLVRGSWTYLPLPAYPGLQVGTGALVVVYGPPGGGKSSLVTRALASVEGPVVLQSTEESPGPALAARLTRCGVRRRGIAVVGRATVDQVVDLCRARRAVVLAVDSVQMATYQPADLRHLLAILAPTLRAVIAVAQVNKGGRIEGREALVHEADVVLHVEGLRWTLTKSRYQPTGLTGPVLPEESSDVPDRSAVPLSALHDAGRDGDPLRQEGPPVHSLRDVRDAGVPAGHAGAEREDRKSVV